MDEGEVMTEQKTPACKITLTMMPDLEPIVQFIDLMLELKNHPAFDIIPHESKLAALEYLSSLGGKSNRLNPDNKLQAMDRDKDYILFANSSINLDDVIKVIKNGAKISIVRIK